MRAEPADVVVTGLGAVTPAGLGVEALWAAVRSGRVCTGPIERVDTTGFPRRVAGVVPDRTLAELDRLVPGHASLAGRYLAAAAAEALAAAGPADGITGVFVGTVMGTRPVLDQAWSGDPSAEERRVWDGPASLLEPLRRGDHVDGPRVLLAPGCAAGNAALELGARAVAAGEVDRAVCAGAEQLSIEVLSLFTSLRALTADVVRPFDRDRTGMAPARARPCSSWSTGTGPRRGRWPGCWRPRPRPTPTTSPSRTRPGTRCAARWWTPGPGRGGPADVGWVCAHGTGTPANDALEARVVGEVLGTAHPAAAGQLGEGAPRPRAGRRGRGGGGGGRPRAGRGLRARHRHPADPRPRLRRGRPGARRRPSGRPAGGGQPGLRLRRLGDDRRARRRSGMTGATRPGGTTTTPRAPRPLPVRVPLAAVTRWAGPETGPERVPADRWAAFDAESVLAVACTERLPVSDHRTSVSWATGTAGGPDYAQVCLDTQAYGPGRASAAAGPRSAFNGPAAAVSICLGLRGPAHTACGGVAAGLNALVDGLAPLRAGEVARAVVGGSTSTPVRVTGTGRARVAEAAAVAAAAVLFGSGPGSGWELTGLARTRLPTALPIGTGDDDLGAAAAELLGPAGLPPGSTVLVVDDLGPAGPAGPAPSGVLRASRLLGDLGAAAVPAALALFAAGTVTSPTGAAALVVLTRARDAGAVLLRGSGKP